MGFEETPIEMETNNQVGCKEIQGNRG